MIETSVVLGLIDFLVCRHVGLRLFPRPVGFLEILQRLPSSGLARLGNNGASQSVEAWWQRHKPGEVHLELQVQVQREPASILPLGWLGLNDALHVVG